MVDVTVDTTQPKERVVLGVGASKSITVDTKQPKEKVVLGKGPSKDVTIDTKQPKEKVVLGKGSKGKPGEPGKDGTFTEAEKLILEMEMAFKVANLTNFKETTFSAGLLLNLSIYTDSGKGTKLFNKDFTYSTGQLTTVVLTRISDSVISTKNLLYNIDGTLLSIDTI